MKPKPKILQLPTLYRSAEIVALKVLERAADAPADSRPKYHMSVSSEYRVNRGFGIEVLSHKKGAIDLARSKRGLAVRDDHFGDQVGIAENPAIDSAAGTLSYDIQFSENPRPQEIERDVAAGIRRFVSLRYTPMKARLLERGTNGNPDVYEITRWEPIHVAFVPDPADPSVGVGRNAADEETHPVAIEGGDPAEEDRSEMCKTCKLDPCTCTAADRNEGGAPATTVVTSAGTGDRSAGGGSPAITGGTDRAAARQKEIAEIVRACQAHGASERAPEFIERGLSLGEVSTEILAGKRTRGEIAPVPDAPAAGLPKKDAKRYSYRNAILAAYGDRKLDGVEREVHEQIAKNQPQNYVARGGVFMPMNLEADEVTAGERLSRALDAYMGRTRALDSKTANAAAELVEDVPGGLIELLRKNTVVMASGARVLTGLTAPIVFPKQTGAGTASWVGENPGSDLADSNLTTGIITLSPKTLQSTTAFSRQLLVLANNDAEAMVRNDLAAIHSIAIDKAAYHGIGAGGQPTGVYQSPDVIAVAVGGAGTWTTIVNMIAQVADSNALDGTLGWVAQTLLAGRYMSVPKVTAQANFLWEGALKEGLMAGYPARATSQLSKVMNGSAETGGSSYGLIFGNWADMIIGMWGAFEVIPDPYAKKKQGLIEVTTFQMTDIMLRHGESFAKGTGATLA